MIELSKTFSEAASDYLFLLEKQYPKKSILKLVGDKYQLTGEERSVLFRGIHQPELCELRKNKLVTTLESSKPLFVDGYNVIRTIGSYLLGKTVFYSTDEFSQ